MTPTNIAQLSLLQSSLLSPLYLAGRGENYHFSSLDLGPATRRPSSTTRLDICKHNYRAHNSCINFHWLWSFMLESWKDCRFWFPIIFSFETKANFMSHVEHISDWGEENWNYDPMTPPLPCLTSQTRQVINIWKGFSSYFK